MRGDNHLLAVTTRTLTADDDPTIPAGETRTEPLFAFPIQVCKATETAKSKFDIAAPSGAVRKQVYIDSATGEVVEDDECPRGLRVSDDDFRPIPAEAITEVKGQKSNMLVAQGRKPLAEIDFTRAEGRYFVQAPPKGGSAKAYRLTYEALRPQRNAKGKVTREAQALLTKRTPRTNEKLCVIYADEAVGCLMLVQLAFTADCRQPDEQVLAPQHADVSDAQIDMAVKVIDSLPDGDDFLDSAVDENIARQDELLEKALLGESITAPTPVVATVEADNLEAMLLASIA